MTEDEHIQRHLEIVQRVYERLVAEGKWNDTMKQMDAVNDESSATP